MRINRKLTLCSGCHSHALGVAVFDDDEDQHIYVEWWVQGGEQPSFWQRLVRAYRFFKDGTYCPNDVILNPESAQEVITNLEEALVIANSCSFENAAAKTESRFREAWKKLSAE